MGNVRAIRPESVKDTCPATCWHHMTKGIVRAAIYCRVSKDAKGEQRSVTEQEKSGRVVCDRETWHIVGVWIDNNVGASSFSKGIREAWNALITEVAAGKIDVIVVWEPSRLTRDRVVWAALMSTCEETNTKINASGRTYDPNDPDEAFHLDLYFALARRESATTRKRVSRTMVESAEQGRPHGPVPAGYRRVHDPETGKLLGRELHPEHAPIMVKAFRKIAAGTPLLHVDVYLRDNGVCPPRAKKWSQSALRNMFTRECYRGKRVYKGKVASDGQWPRLIDDETFYAVGNIFAKRAKEGTRPARATHMVSSYARCGVCKQTVTARRKAQQYICWENACVTISELETDAHISAYMIRYLSQEHIFAELVSADDAEIASARAELEKIEAERRELDETVKAGGMSPRLAGLAEQALDEREAKAQEAIKNVGVPSLLRGMVGPDAAKAWHAIDDLSIKRQMIAALIEIEIRPSSEYKRMGRRGGINVDRIKITPKDLKRKDHALAA